MAEKSRWVYGFIMFPTAVLPNPRPDWLAGFGFGLLAWAWEKAN
jgi:hypothetical protein